MVLIVGTIYNIIQLFNEWIYVYHTVILFNDIITNEKYLDI